MGDNIDYSEQERELFELREYKAMREKVDAFGRAHQQELENQRIAIMEQIAKMGTGKQPEPVVMTMRSLRPEEVTFSVVLADEDHQPSETEPELIQYLADNPKYGWYYVEVRATWNEWVGIMGIGECVCLDADEFKSKSGYYEDMRKEALYDLNLQLQDAFEKLKPLIR